MSQLFDHFGARTTLAGDSHAYYRLQTLQDQGIGQIDRLPYSIKVLLESAYATVTVIWLCRTMSKNWPTGKPKAIAGENYLLNLAG